MADQVLVSVLMTVYNRELFIADAIKSVLASSLTDFELIIVDDCSRDKSMKIAQEFAGMDGRIIIHKNETNLGDYPNRNRAASFAKGKYLKYVDSDDTISTDALQKMVEALEQHPEAALAISSRFNDLPPVGTFIVLTPAEAYEKHFTQFGFLDNGPSWVMVRRACFEEAGGFGIKRNVSDFEMWLKLAAQKSVVLLPKGLIHWREHEGQEFSVAPDCYTEHQLGIVRNALSNEKLLSAENRKKVLFLYRRAAVTGIIKDFLRKKDGKRFLHLYKSNALKLSDFFLVFKRRVN